MLKRKNSDTNVRIYIFRYVSMIIAKTHIRGSYYFFNAFKYKKWLKRQS